MGLFSRDMNKIEKLVFEYFDETYKCIECSKQNISVYLNNNSIDNEFYDRWKEVHSFESKSDDMRKNIEFLMYQESLIPESRGDILGLLETVDGIPNCAEILLMEIYTGNISIPQKFADRYKELVYTNIEAALLAIEMVKKYFTARKEIGEYQKKIDTLESQSDRIQMSFTRDVMTSTEISDFHKLLLKNLIYLTGKLSDKAENIADRVKILSVKTVF